MATLKPELVVKLDLDSAGVLKGVTITQKALGGLGSTVTKTTSKVDGLKKSLGAIWRITGGIILFNIIRKVTQAFEGLIQVGLDFEEQMYNINSVAHLGAEEFQNLTDEVIDLVLDPRIKDGPAKLAAGLYEIASAGYSTADALVVLEQAALASTAGMTTSEVAADVLVSTLGAYNLGVDKAAFVTNQLFQIINISKYTFEDLASALDSVTPTAAALGIGMDAVGAAMATFAKRGVDAETATVQMNAILSAMLKPTTAMKDALKELGYETGQQMIEQEGFIKTMQIWAQVLDGDAGKAAALFGDVRALRGLMTLTNDDAVELTKNFELMGEAQEDGGAMSKALAEQMKSNSFQIAVLRKNIEILAVLGFGLIAPHLNKALNAVNKFISGMVVSFRHFREKGYDFVNALRAAIKTVFTDMFGEETGKKAEKLFMDLVDWFYKLRAAAEAVFPYIVKLAKLLVDNLNIVIWVATIVLAKFLLWNKIVPILKLMRVHVLALRLALLMLNPWFLLIAAAILLFAVAYKKNWLGIRDITKTVVKFVVEAFERLSNALKGRDNLRKALEGLPEPIQKILIGLRRLVVLFDDIFHGRWDELQRDWERLGQTIGNFFKSIGLENFGQEFKETFRLIGVLIADVIDLIDDIVHGRWDEVWGDLKSIAVDYLHFIFQEFIMIGALLWDAISAVPWKDIGMFLLEKSADLAKAIWDGMRGFWGDTIRPWLGDRVDAIEKAILSKTILLYNVGRTLLSWVWTGIASLMSWFIDAIYQIPNGIYQVFKNFGIWFYNIGRNIVSGIWTGIASLGGWLWDMVETFVKNKIVGAFNWALGSNSPAKKMMPVGEDTTKGFAIGMLKASAAVVDATKRIASIPMGGTGEGSRFTGGMAPQNLRLTPSTSTQSRTLNFAPGAIVVNESSNAEATAQEIMRRIYYKEAGAV